MVDTAVIEETHNLSLLGFLVPAAFACAPELFLLMCTVLFKIIAHR